MFYCKQVFVFLVCTMLGNSSEIFLYERIGPRCQNVSIFLYCGNFETPQVGLVHRLSYRWCWFITAAISCGSRAEFMYPHLAPVVCQIYSSTRDKNFYLYFALMTVFRLPNIASRQKQKKLSKYLLRRRVNSRHKASQRDYVITNGRGTGQGINISTSEISLQRLNDFDKYLRRFFCVTEVSSAVVWWKKFKFYLTSLFSIECFWSKQSRIGRETRVFQTEKKHLR